MHRPECDRLENPDFGTPNLNTVLGHATMQKSYGLHAREPRVIFIFAMSSTHPIAIQPHDTVEQSISVAMKLLLLVVFVVVGTTCRGFLLPTKSRSEIISFDRARNSPTCSTRLACVSSGMKNYFHSICVLSRASSLDVVVSSCRLLLCSGQNDFLVEPYGSNIGLCDYRGS